MRPAKRGSGQISIKDLHRLDELVKEMEEKKSEGRPSDSETQPAADWDKSIKQLSEDIEKLRKFTAEHTENDDDKTNKS